MAPGGAARRSDSSEAMTWTEGASRRRQLACCRLDVGSRIRILLDKIQPQAGKWSAPAQQTVTCTLIYPAHHASGGAPPPHLAVEHQGSTGRRVPAPLRQQGRQRQGRLEIGSCRASSAELSWRWHNCILLPAQEDLLFSSLAAKHHPHITTQGPAPTQTSPPTHLYEQLEVAGLGCLLVCDRHPQVVHVVSIGCRAYT